MTKFGYTTFTEMQQVAVFVTTLPADDERDRLFRRMDGPSGTPRTPLEDHRAPQARNAPTWTASGWISRLNWPRSPISLRS